MIKMPKFKDDKEMTTERYRQKSNTYKGETLL